MKLVQMPDGNGTVYYVNPMHIVDVRAEGKGSRVRLAHSAPPDASRFVDVLHTQLIQQIDEALRN